MNRLEVGLELRGFFVTEKEGTIRFSDKKHPNDIVLLQRLLKNCALNILSTKMIFLWKQISWTMT